MIIPALVRLYDRMAESGSAEVAPPGYSLQQVSFKVVLRKNGELVGFEPVFNETRREIKPKRVASGKPAGEPTFKVERRPQRLCVPGQSKPSGSGLNPCFLWDNAAYMLGFKAEDPNPERTRDTFKAFRERHLAAKEELRDSGFAAVCKFLESWRPSDARGYKDLADITTNFGVFQLIGDHGYVHERAPVREWWASQMPGTDDDSGDAEADYGAPSLTDGKTQAIARLHEPKIKGVAGAQSSGATLVSFNQSAFTSYGKEQGENAPVGVEDARKYCEALNRLTTDDLHRVRIAGDTYVFWTEGEPEANRAFCGFFNLALDGATSDKLPIDATQIRGFMQRVRSGLNVEEFGEASTPFYLLGVAPNIARLSIRLWIESDVRSLTHRIGEHIARLQIEPNGGDQELTVRRLVSETAPPKGGFADSERVIPTLAGDVTRAILTGGPYPRALYVGVLDRVRIEGLADSQTRNDFRDAQHRRCAVIRAYLTHNHRLEVPVSLDPQRSDPPYLLGRLFAVLERTQENALGQINRTIKDSYYSAASSTPAAIFPRLLSLTRHHLAKIEHVGQRKAREIELGSIMNNLNDFARSQSLESQGLFAIGYYHQRQSYFQKHEERAAE